jgi:sugar lactone lactonase YvrE
MLCAMALWTQSPSMAQGPADRRGESKAYRLTPSTHGNPEGVTYDDATGTFFVGSIGDGTIYRGKLGEPNATEFILGGPGGEAAGLKAAKGKLHVAGGFSGTLRVYDIATKQRVAAFQNFGAGMLNDLVVTPEGDVYVTDSFVPRLWHITGAQIASGGFGAPQGIPLEPEIQFDPNDFNLNGIVALKGGRSLIVVQSNNGKLFRIDLDEHAPQGRRIEQIAVEPLIGGDGLLLDGGDLLVVQGGPKPMLNYVRLSANADKGVVVERRTDPAMRDSSTIARAKTYYLIANLDLLNNVTPFTVAAIPRSFNDDEQ